MENKVYFILFIAFTFFQASDSLKCYACSSSSGIYDADCDAGSSNVRSGTCPTDTKYYCIIRRTTNDVDGTSTVLRDCSSRPNSLDYSCTSDLCNTTSGSFTRGQDIWILTFGFLFLYCGGPRL